MEKTGNTEVFYLPYFILASNSHPFKKMPMEFHNIKERSPWIIPYTSHITIPTNIDVLKIRLISRALFNLYTLIICGTVANVVNKPPTRPRYSTEAKVIPPVSGYEIRSNSNTIGLFSSAGVQVGF